MEKKKIVDLEDLIAWRKAKDLSVSIYKVCNSNQNLKSDYGYSNQLKRASLSVVLNIAEGFGRGGNKEFLNFLGIARGSISEVRTLLTIGLELGYLSEEEQVLFIEKYIEVEKIVKGLQNYLKQSELKGYKYDLREESENYLANFKGLTTNYQLTTLN